MTAAVEMTLYGAAELSDLWRRAPEMCRQELTAAMLEAELLLQREVKELTPVGVGGGGLRGSITALNPRAVGDSVIGVVGSPLNYAEPVEVGTRPHFPPLEPLEDWVRQKLDVAEEEVPGVALAIARKIAARGTVAVGMFHRAFAANRAQVARMFQAATRRIVVRLGG